MYHDLGSGEGGGKLRGGPCVRCVPGPLVCSHGPGLLERAPTSRHSYLGFFNFADKILSYIYLYTILSLC